MKSTRDEFESLDALKCSKEPTASAEAPDYRMAKRGGGSLYRLHIEAVGLRQADAAAYALRLIGMMMQSAHAKGHSCGGETGNASGNWENAGSPNDKVSDPA